MSAVAFLLFGFTAPAVSAAENFAWPDRRPIGAIFLANSGQNWPKNPRGYFNDPNLDVNTAEGKAELRRRMMALADSTIARVKDVGGQGIIVWDIEGDEMPHAVTYLGDPRILPRVAPEMDAIADEFFAKFREAGIATGICIRPSSIVFKDEGEYPWIKGKYGHTDGPDPVGVLAEKIAYAKKRWGCSIFYMDTNFTPKLENAQMVRKKNGVPDFRMLSGAEMAELRRRAPDALIWPEFQEPDYFASCSGFAEYFRVGKIGELAITAYPGAFHVWMPRMQPGDIYASWDEFVEKGIMKGEVFLFECSPAMSPMGDLLKNARSEVALRRAKITFKPAEGTDARILQLREEKDWARRRVLVDSLVQDPSAAATAALDEVFRNETTGLQWFAARALARQGTPAALDALKIAVSEKDELKIPAVKALGVSGKPEMAATLIPLLESKGNPAVRWAAIDALGELGNREATPALIAFMKSLEGTPAMSSREKTVRALGLLGDPQAVPALQSALNDKDYARLRTAILQSLAKLGAPVK